MVEDIVIDQKEKVFKNFGIVSYLHLDYSDLKKSKTEVRLEDWEEERIKNIIDVGKVVDVESNKIVEHNETVMLFKVNIYKIIDKVIFNMCIQEVEVIEDYDFVGMVKKVIENLNIEEKVETI